MAQEAGPNSTSPSDDGLPPINYWPNDEPIVSIRDARRRLALADGFGKDLLELALEVAKLEREALTEAGKFTVEATYDAKLARSLLTGVPAPDRWGNEWAIDLVYAGEFYDNPRRFQALTRVAAYVGIPVAEVRAVSEAIGEAVDSLFGEHRARELVGQLRDIYERLLAARGDYLTLRDSIAGRLDRMQAEVGDERHGESGGSGARQRTPAHIGEFPSGQRLQSPKPASRGPKRSGRPRMECRTDAQSRARFNLYQLIISRRQEASTKQALADLLNTERDIRDLASQAGFANGVTVEAVRQADQFVRDRQKASTAENRGR